METYFGYSIFGEVKREHIFITQSRRGMHCIRSSDLHVYALSQERRERWTDDASGGSRSLLPFAAGADVGFP